MYYMRSEFMGGGFREGAGRKKIKNSALRKKPYSIYLDDLEYEAIKNIKLPKVNSFSQKCVELILLGMENYNVQSNTNCIKYIDLFSGMGGTRIGFEKALEGMGLSGQCVFSCDIKDTAVKVYKENFNEDAFCDITSVDERNLPDFDILLAGFPCQAFSQAGLGLGFKDTRGTLFFDIARILKEKKPKGFLLENVEGLVNHDSGKTFNIIKNTLNELGYNIEYAVLNSKNFGLAQSRRRIYIIGVLNGEPKPLINFKESKKVLGDIIDYSVPPEDSEFTRKLLKHYNLEELYGKAIKDKRGGPNNIHSWDLGLKGEVNEEQKELLEKMLLERRKKKWASMLGIEWMDGMPLTKEMIETFYPHKDLQGLLDNLVEKGYLVLEHPKQRVNGRRVPDTTLKKGYNIVTGKLSFEFSKILSPFEPTPTLVATDIHKLAIPVNGGIRKLTVNEGLKLFGYPKDYSMDSITENEAFDLLGNTVCVPVIEQVSVKLLQSIYN